jgi:spoIIIJ-associated protein
MTDLHAEPYDTDAHASPRSFDPTGLNPGQHAGLTLMEEIGAAMEHEVHAVARDVQGAYLHIELVGETVPGTWGRSGQALDALQFLANMILARRHAGDVRLMLDADNYRSRRAEALRVRAIDLAQEVKARNEEAELEPLPARERRIIHSALADDPDISTYSEGDEPGRHVVISPRR